MLQNKLKIFAVLMMLVSAQLFAQDKSLEKPGQLNQFYVDVVGRLGYIDCDAAIFRGLRAGYNLTENISVGLSGHVLVSTDHESFVNYQRNDKIDLSYGGIESFYRCDMSEHVYMTAGVAMGVAKVEYQSNSGDDWFGLIQPRTSVNYRFADWFGLGYSIDYRFATGVKFGEFSNASFSGWSTSLSLKFGF